MENIRVYLNSLGARWGKISGVECVLDYSHDVDSEFAIQSEVLALKANGIAYRGERSTIVGLGDDLIPLIQGRVTGDVFQLEKSGSGMRTCAVDIKGKMVFDLRLLHIEEMLLIDLEPGIVAAGLLSYFTNSIINEDAEFIDRSEGLSKIAFFGKYGLERVCELCSNLDSTLKLKKFDATRGRFQNDDIIVQRIDFGAIPAYEVLIQKEKTIDFLKRALQQGSVLIGESAQEKLRFMEGVPRFALDRTQRMYGAELSTDMIPLEANLNDWISFTKGCYLGQEIIARLDSRGEPAKFLRKFTYVKKFEVGSPLFVDKKKVGLIVMCTTEDHEHFEYAALIKRKFNSINASVFLDIENTHPVTIQSYN